MNIKQAYDAVSAGQTVQLRPHGNSMSGKIESGQLITIAPCSASGQGDIVLCKVNGRIFIHLVKSIDHQGRCQIANNHGRVNGWASKVVGKVIKVEP